MSRAVNLDFLCHSKGNGITLEAPVQKTKIHRQEIINDVTWCNFLVPNDKFVSLSDREKNLERKFVVCLNIPNEDKIARSYAAFESVLDFIGYIRKIPRDRWHFFEVIRGSQPQKLYFDIDISQERFEKLGVIKKDMKIESQQKEMDTFCRKLISDLVKGIVKAYHNRKYQLNLIKNILLFTSHSMVKRSFHLIVTGFAVSNNDENKILANEATEDLSQEQKECVDTLYSKIQQLRLYQSQKAGSGRPKVLLDKWYYYDNLIERPRTDLSKLSSVNSELRQAAEFTMLFQQSCVTYIGGCVVIPILFEKVQDIIRSTEDDLEDLDPKVVASLSKRIKGNLFKVYKIDRVIGSLVLLKRILRAHCSLCDRIHESENAFLRVNKHGKIYFYCRRNNQGTKLMGDISDLMPVLEGVKEEFQTAHLESLMRGNTLTLHAQLRNLAGKVKA